MRKTWKNISKLKKKLKAQGKNSKLKVKTQNVGTFRIPGCRKCVQKKPVLDRTYQDTLWMSHANLLDDSPNLTNGCFGLKLNVSRFFIAKAHHDPCPHVNVEGQKKKGL